MFRRYIEIRCDKGRQSGTAVFIEQGGKSRRKRKQEKFERQYAHFKILGFLVSLCSFVAGAFEPCSRFHHANGFFWWLCAPYMYWLCVGVLSAALVQIRNDFRSYEWLIATIEHYHGIHTNILCDIISVWIIAFTWTESRIGWHRRNQANGNENVSIENVSMYLFICSSTKNYTHSLTQSVHWFVRSLVRWFIRLPTHMYTP